ncbi:MAG: hypothetical protein K8R88_03340 [Armatimonadetes bacterium]|nr:hypothetical protein [Armatimonadota bacterium]
MKKLILSSLFASALAGMSMAQNVFDTSAKAGFGNYYVDFGAAAPGHYALGNDITWTLPNALPSINLGSMQFIVFNKNLTTAENCFARIRFYSFFDDSASATSKIYDNVTYTLDADLGSIAFNSAFIFTVTMPSGINLTPAGTLAYDIAYYSDAARTVRTGNITQFFNRAYDNGNPFKAGSSLIGWGADNDGDGNFIGNEYWAFGPPNDTLAPWVVMTPAGTKITGTITLQDWVPPTTDKAVSYELRDAGANVVYSGTVTLDVAGAYTAVIPDTIPAGTYDMAFKGSTWLFKKNSVTIDGVTPIIGNDYSLLNGNCANADQAIDLSDYTQVVTAFNALLVDPNNGGLPSANWDALADVNGDAGVDLTDYTVVVSNFNALGD